ncbi:helix-turn-helix domain-containing protein [Sphaerisporangium viridialbum]|uniref:helix-turn-helix domain-containing protein n=1 Tax=Sphaerisporangium viridialbum TaxID=46189 RepID=UPI003C71FCC0
MLSLISTDHVAPSHRFDFWWEAVATSIIPVHGNSDRRADFRAEMRSLDLGPVQLTRGLCVPFQARRTPALIRRSDPGLYHLSMTRRGSSLIQQEGREVRTGSADFVLYDTSRTFHVVTDPYGGTARRAESVLADGLILQFPRDLLPLPSAMVERLLVRRMSGFDGVGLILAGVLRQLVRQSETLSPGDAARLSTVVLDLVAALVAHEAEGDAWRPADDEATALFVRVQAFAEQRLGQADLTPSMIAAAHHVSTRYLHRLFQRQGLTVAGWIRRRRLERCRRDLADPAMDGCPVNAVAARWGFADGSHFNRLFRTTYGMPPAAYRRDRREPDVRERSTAMR